MDQLSFIYQDKYKVARIVHIQRLIAIELVRRECSAFHSFYKLARNRLGNLTAHKLQLLDLHLNIRRHS